MNSNFYKQPSTQNNQIKEFKSNQHDQTFNSLDSTQQSVLEGQNQQEMSKYQEMNQNVLQNKKRVLLNPRSNQDASRMSDHIHKNYLQPFIASQSVSQNASQTHIQSQYLQQSDQAELQDIPEESVEFIENEFNIDFT